MVSRPHLWVLAGGNGAGKSTFFETRLKQHGIAFVNADLIQRAMFKGLGPEASYSAAKLAGKMRDKLLEERRSFCFESVFSHGSKIDFIAKAKSLGYKITLVYIHLSDDNLNLARVAGRVSTGGHHVPDDKVLSRIPRVLQLMQTALQIVDSAYLLDNSSADNPFQVVARVNAGKVEPKVEPLPAWAQTMLQT
ncbi:MAG: hypothetical protein CME36_08115 [unclassified Hahellaceae]|nr:hypothetical protein [Hahellaceae bacterium]